MSWSDAAINLVYVMVGFILGAGWELYKENRDKDEEAKNIRQILAEEIRYNKTILKEVATSIREEERRYGAAKEQNSFGELLTDADPWRKLRSFAPSRLSTDAWNSQIPKIPAVLNSNEASKLFVFYRGIAEIQGLQAEYIDQWHGSGMDEPMQRLLFLMEEVANRPLSIIK